MFIMGLQHGYADVMKSLTRLILFNANNDKREEAAHLKKLIGRFEFVLHIAIMTKIPAEINISFQYWQGKDADLQRVGCP